jgi:hypothetical protein
LIRGIQQGDNRILRRAIEKRANQMPHRRFSLRFERCDGLIHVARALNDMAHVALVLQNPEQRPYGRVTWRRRQLRLDGGRGRPLEAMKDVHDLAFSPGQGVRLGSGHFIGTGRYGKKLAPC